MKVGYWVCYSNDVVIKKLHDNAKNDNSSWEDNMKMDFKDLGYECVDWIHMS
jgi:hypothetical protein